MVARYSFLPPVQRGDKHLILFFKVKGVFTVYHSRGLCTHYNVDVSMCRWLTITSFGKINGLEDAPRNYL